MRTRSRIQRRQALALGGVFIISNELNASTTVEAMYNQALLNVRRAFAIKVIKKRGQIVMTICLQIS